MKTLNIYAVVLLSIFSINISFAQIPVKNETIKVSGNCGMCKNKIEKSAKSAGATFANWNSETQVLNIVYTPSETNSQKIQKAIAAAGYETESFKADDKAYNNLHGCCKYERNTAFAGSNGKTSSYTDCKDMECCQDKGCCDKNSKCNSNACKEKAECKDMKCCKS